MSRIIIFLNICLINFYKYFISPLLGSKCRYLPSCSEYYKESLNTFGLLKGSALGIKRILICHPFKTFGGGSGLDLVPNKKKIKREE